MFRKALTSEPEEDNIHVSARHPRPKQMGPAYPGPDQPALYVDLVRGHRYRHLRPKPPSGRLRHGSGAVT